MCGVSVLGATGPLGGAAVRRLAENGAAFRALVRDPVGLVALAAGLARTFGSDR